jgi:SAM-dependent methyltransferase
MRFSRNFVRPVTSTRMSSRFAIGAAGLAAIFALRRSRSAASARGSGSRLSFDEYAARHLHFTTGEIPPLLVRTARPGLIGDLGCGDGAILHALHVAGKLGDRSYGIDVSPVRVSRAESVPGVIGIVADAAHVPLADESLDGIVCSQVIEHVPDERELISEIARLLRPGGWWYVGSILRGPRAWWIYKHDGRRWLDPTHVREYGNEAEFRRAVEHASLDMKVVQSCPTRYPILDLVLRAVRVDRSFYERHPWCVRLRALRIRVPGYRLVEAVGEKRARSSARLSEHRPCA